MTIPLVDLKAQYAAIKDEVDVAIQGVLERGDFIQGADVVRFEEEFADFCGVPHAVGVSSGTEALHLALLACDVGPGDEVITTPHTFIATAEAITQVGATPVFADIDPQTYNIDPDQIEMCITDRTRAIVPVHLYGHPADMPRIMALAKRHGLRVIEDAAQAHGAMVGGRSAGSIGDIGCFSCYPGKNLGAYGDAGIVVSNDPDLAEDIRLLRDHGRKGKYDHLRPGINGRLDTLQAAVLRVKLARLGEWNALRAQAADSYRRHLVSQPVGLPAVRPGCTHVYHLFVITSNRRDMLREALAERGIASGVHYPIPLHLQAAYRSLGYKKGDFPHTEKAADSVLSLPLFPELREEQVSEVSEAISAALGAEVPVKAAG